MTLRKTAGLLAALGLLVGLMQSGVAAQFADQVTATQNINVGSFGCIIDSATNGSSISLDKKTVTLDSGDINSSAAGSAPFSFTVKSTGSIPVVLHLTQTTPPTPFSSLLADPVADVTLTQDQTHAYDAGLQWTELGMGNLGTSVGIVYTIACNEAPPSTPLIHYAFNSTNADNIAGTAPGHPGTVGPSVSVVDNGGGSLTLNFTAGSQTTYAHCFEYVTNGNVPQQKLAENGGVNYNTGDVDTHVVVLDGLFPYTCLYNGHPTDSVTLNVGAGGYVEVRMVFGAEADYRFDWTRFNAS